MSGWIQLHRSLIDWEWYDDANTMRLFLHCCLRANFEDAQWRGIDIKRGDFITSTKTLSKELKLSENKIRLSIKKLISTGEITSKTTNKNTTITVCNYDTYNSNKSENNKQDNKPYNNQTTNKPQSNHNQTTTDNKNNNNKQEEEEDKGTPSSTSEKPIDPKYLSFCKYYYDKLVEAGNAGFISKIKKNVNCKSKGWLDSIRLLETADGVEWHRIQKVARWYFDHNIKSNYATQAYSMSSLREKFNSMESNMKKDNPSFEMPQLSIMDQVKHDKGIK
jgi:hypothetical protein